MATYHYTPDFDPFLCNKYADERTQTSPSPADLAELGDEWLGYSEWLDRGDNAEPQSDEAVALNSATRSNPISSKHTPMRKQFHKTSVKVNHLML